jgi:hypothetical protein
LWCLCKDGQGVRTHDTGEDSKVPLGVLWGVSHGNDGETQVKGGQRGQEYQCARAGSVGKMNN